MKKFTEVKHLLTALEADADKFYNKGNLAAGTRLRKGMQDLKNIAQTIRIEILETKGSAGDTGPMKNGADDTGPDEE
jgi:hypothetical protein